MPDPLQELLAAGAVPTTSFPPTSRYVERRRRPRGIRATARRRCRSCAAASARAPDRFALLYEVRVVEGDRRDLLGARHLGDAELWWRLADAQRRRRSARPPAAGRPAAAHHAARGHSGGRRVSEPVRLQLLHRARRAGAGAARRHRRRAGGEGRVRLGRDAERLRAHLPALERGRRCTRCSCSPAASSIPIFRVVIAVTHPRHDDGADGRRDDRTTRSAPTPARRRR